MSVTNLTILSPTTVGTPSGNYDGSSTSFNSDAQKAVNYYQGYGSEQTVFIGATNFSGVVTLQATLDQNPDIALWFDIYDYDTTSSVVTDYHPVNLTGNFVWMRAAISNFEAGTIGVTITY